MAAMGGMAEATTSAATEMPRFMDGPISLREAPRRLAGLSAPRKQRHAAWV